MRIKEKPGEVINITFIHMFYKYLFLHEGIYQLSEVNEKHLEKFLVYWYPRMILDYTATEIMIVIKQMKQYVKWCLTQNVFIHTKDGFFDEIQEELVRIQKISSQISLIKSQIERKTISGGESIWLKKNETKKTTAQMISSWFWFQKVDSKKSILKNIKNGQVYQIKNDHPIKKLKLKDEIITLEIYNESQKAEWKIVNIGIVYSPKAVKYLLN